MRIRVAGRGERREIDYGAAIEMLWRFLRERPDSPIALFNRAVVYERLFLYDDALKDWEHYLNLDGAGAWTQEARERKQTIERKIAGRVQAVKSLDSRSGYLESVKNGQSYDPEFYLDWALTNWLPAAPTDPAAGEALQILARLLQEKHRDAWLKDLLQAKQNQRESGCGGAISQRREATIWLGSRNRHWRRHGRRNGAIVKRAFGRARSGRNTRKCTRCSAQWKRSSALLLLFLWSVRPQRHYGWIFIQALTEARELPGVGNGGNGQANLERALAEAHARGYKTLELRVLGLQQSHATNRGNQVAAWQQITDRLADLLAGSVSCD